MRVGWWNASTLPPSFGGMSWGQGAALGMILPALSSCRCQCTHAHQVVYGGRKGKYPSEASHPRGSGLARQAHRLHPAEDLLHPFAALLTDAVPSMPRRAAIDRARSTRRVLRHMECRPQLSELSDEVPGVIVLVGAQRHAMLTGNGLHHGQRHFALSRARRLGHTRIHHQAMAFLREYMPQATEFGFLPLRLLVQTGVEIGGGGMRGFGAPLPVEVNAGIAGIVRGLGERLCGFPDVGFRLLSKAVKDLQIFLSLTVILFLRFRNIRSFQPVTAHYIEIILVGFDHGFNGHPWNWRIEYPPCGSVIDQIESNYVMRHTIGDKLPSENPIPFGPRQAFIDNCRYCAIFLN